MCAAPVPSVIAKKRLVRQCTQVAPRVQAGGEPLFGVLARIYTAVQEEKMARLFVGGLMAFVIGSVAFAQTPQAPALPRQYQDMAAAMAAAQAKAVKPGDEALGCAAIEKELMTSMNDPAVQAFAAKSAAAAQLPAGAAGRGAATPQAAAAMAAALSSNAAIAAAMASAGTTPRGSAPVATPQQAQAAMQQALAAQGMTPQQIQAMQAQALAAQQALANPQVQAALQAQAAALADPQVQAALRAQTQALATPQAQAALAAQSAQLAQLQDPSAQLAMMTTVMPQMMRSQRLVGLAMAKGCTSLGAVPVAPPVKR
jgi:hypothetical protein